MAALLHTLPPLLVASSKNPKHLLRTYQPLIDHLQAQLPDYQFELEASRDYASYERKIEARAPALLLPNPLQTLTAIDRGYTVVAMAGDPEEFRGVLLVPVDSPHRTLGQLLAHAVRDSGAGLQEVMTVQTYHVALALAHHGVGVAMVEGCTAASADRERVDVLTLEPAIAPTVHMLRPTARPNSLTTRAFTRCMQQALQQLG